MINACRKVLFGKTVKKGNTPDDGSDPDPSKFGGFKNKIEFATNDPGGYAAKYPNG